MTTWLKRLIANDIQNLIAELRQRYFDTHKKYRNAISYHPQQATTYYDSVVEEYQSKVNAQSIWHDFQFWLKNIEPTIRQSGDPQGIKDLTLVMEEVNNRLAQNLTPPNPQDFHNFIDEDVVRFYLDRNNLNAVFDLLEKNNMPFDTVKAPSGKEITTLDFGQGTWVVEGDTYYDNADDWIRDAADRSEDFFPELNFNEEFWSGIGHGSFAYHATSSENVPAIMKSGLHASNKTRGLRNTDMGSAVFAITDEYIDDVSAALDSYGDAIIVINLDAMKRDGYMPEVEKETPVQEAEIRESLAHLIGEDNYNAEYESDYMPDTIAIYGDIPAKYLSVL